MSNLIDELGYGYFHERFGGSLMFTPDGRPAVITNVGDGGNVIVDATSGPVGKLSVEKVTIPKEHFKNMAVLAVPALGWRAASKGRFMALYTRNNRSYQRGISINNLNTVHSEHTQFLLNNGEISYSYYGRATTTAALIMQPQYIRMSEGLRDMRDGEIMGFAVSANLAVLPYNEEHCILMFNNMQVGTVDFNGTINCTIPTVERMFKETM